MSQHSENSTCSNGYTGDDDNEEQEEMPYSDQSSSESDPEPLPEKSIRTRKQKKKPKMWANEDVIFILNRILSFVKKGHDPSCDKAELIAFLRKSTKGRFASIQLLGKVKRLRYNFRTISRNGEPTTFKNNHKRMVYEISKKIWGDNDEKGNEESKASDVGAAAVAHWNKSRSQGLKKSKLLLREKRKKVEMMELEFSVKHVRFIKVLIELMLREFKKASGL